MRGGVVGSKTECSRTFYAALGGRVKAAREAAGLSQEALADHLGIGRTTLSHWEVGRQRLPLPALYLISQATGAAVGDLLPEKGFDK